MVQLVLIAPSILKKIDFKKVKQTIRSYVGTRLIDTDSEEIPGIILKEKLSKDDKKYLQKEIFPDNDGCLVFVDVNEDIECPEYLNATMIAED